MWEPDSWDPTQTRNGHHFWASCHQQTKFYLWEECIWERYCLKSQWIQAHQDLAELVKLTPSAVNSLRWWMENQNLRVGSPTHCPKPNVQVFTDSRLGCTLRHVSCVRKVDQNQSQVTHKFTGTNGWAPSTKTLGTWFDKQCGSGSNGQLHSSRICEQARGGGISRFLCLETKNPWLWSHKRSIHGPHSHTCKTHTRETECACQFTFARWADTAHRMVNITDNI